MQDALNGQVTAELESAYVYLSMAAWFESQNLPGSAKWMRRQAREEAAHAMKIFDFIADRDGRVKLAALPAPPAEWAEVQDVWAAAYAHEQKISGAIGRLVELAAAEKDHASYAMLQWFVTEQVEEEKTAKSILDQVKMIRHSTALYFIDRHLGKDAEKE